jgi:hypothetical protein
VKIAEHLTREQVVYLDTVRRGLRDTPKEFRDELLADLSVTLEELSPEAPVVEMLGDASEYARLAREAAGLPQVSARPFAYARAATWRTRALIAGALVLALAGTSIGIGVTHYQPLRSDPFFSYSSAPTVDSLLPTSGLYWQYQEGAPVVVGGGLHNSGRATVTVTGVSVPNSSGPFTVVELRATRDEHVGGEWTRATPTPRVSVHPGETVYIFVVMKMSHVQLGTGDSESEALPTLQLEVLGVHHRLPIGHSDIGVVAQ